MRANRLTSRVGAIAGLVLAAGLCPAQWVAYNLRPAGSSTSQVYCVLDGVQSGVAFYSGRSHAGYWSGTAGSWVDLDDPAFVYGSYGEANEGTTVVGATFDENDDGEDYSRAAMWTGSAASFVDLHPEGIGAESSRAYAISGGLQGGIVRLDDANRATLWMGTPDSRIDLHPDVAGNSYVRGMTGDLASGEQIGYATVPLSHACIWRGSATSWTDLHPDGWFASQGWETDGAQQVGWVINDAIVDHPALWSGSAASFVDLLPTGWRDGKAQGVFNGKQIGYARPAIGIEYHALVWNGSRDDYDDLHAVLPDGAYIRSTGFDIWSDGRNWYAVGQAVTASFVSDPMLWIMAVDGACAPDLTGEGDVNTNDFFQFLTYYQNQDPRADFDRDGLINTNDFFAFLAAYQVGC